MTRRALSPSLVVAAVLADAQGEHRLAFYALFAAIPALVLVVTGTALRAPMLTEGAVPGVALSALVLAVALVALQGVLELARGRLERQRPRRVVRQVD